MGKLEPIWVLSKIRTSDYTSNQKVACPTSLKNKAIMEL